MVDGRGRPGQFARSALSSWLRLNYDPMAASVLHLTQDTRLKVVHLTSPVIQPICG